MNTKTHFSLSRLRNRQTGHDAGIAMAIVLFGVVAFLAMGFAIAAVVMQSVDTVGAGRERDMGFEAAESGLDVAIAQITSNDGSSLPCVLTGKPDVTGKTTYTVKIDYYATWPPAAGEQPMPCGANNQPIWDGTGANAPKSGVITSTGSMTTPHKGTAVTLNNKRTLQQLATFQIIGKGYDFGSAIYADMTWLASGESSGPGLNIAPAAGMSGSNVYVNGDFTGVVGGNGGCSGKNTITGNLIVYGNVSGGAGCTVTNNVYVKGNYSWTGKVLGNLYVDGNVTIPTSGKVLGGIYTTGTFTGSPTAGASITQNMTSVPIPVRQTFPQVTYDSSTAAQWQQMGFTKVLTLNEKCATTWLQTKASTETQNTIIRVISSAQGSIDGGATICKTNWSTDPAIVQDKGVFFGTNTTLSINSNIAVIADYGITWAAGGGVKSASAAPHNFYAITPYNSPVVIAGSNPVQCKPPNTYDQGGGALSFRGTFVMAPEIKGFFYTPCHVNKQNDTTINGQMYAPEIHMENNLQLNFAKMSVPTVTSAGYYVSPQIRYRREVTPVG